MSFCLGLSLPLFPSITSLCRESLLIMCPVQFFCLALIIYIKDLFFFHLFQYYFIRFVLCPANPLPYSFIHSFIHSGYLYSAPSRNLLRGALSPATVKEKCLK